MDGSGYSGFRVAAKCLRMEAASRVRQGSSVKRVLALLCGVALALPVLPAVEALFSSAQPGNAALAQQATTSEAPRSRATASSIAIPNLPLGLVTFPNGKAFNLNVAMGSALFRRAGDPPGRVWMVTDRGPSLDCQEARRLFGQEPEQVCPGPRGGRIYPLPGFAPSIYAADIGTDNVARISVFLPLKGRSGRPVTGRPPAGMNGRVEAVFGIDFRPIPGDPSGVDPEAIIRLGDGTFWIAEEFGPSLLHVATDGTILKRLVPAGTAQEFRDADYEIVASLPAITRLRQMGRGFEGLAVSPDERFLYVMMQSALANPDADTFRRSRHLRLWKIERVSGAVTAEYLYQIDEARAFSGDVDQRERPASVVSVGEIALISEDRLLVQERIDRTSRIFAVTLTDEARIPAIFDNPDYQPTLEQLDAERLAIRGVRPLEKELVFDTDQIPGLPAKIEGMAILSPNELLLVNDNDFGIDGVRTQMFRVTLPEPIR
jgi:hypothetical protein